MSWRINETRPQIWNIADEKETNFRIGQLRQLLFACFAFADKILFVDFHHCFCSASPLKQLRWFDHCWTTTFVYGRKQLMLWKTKNVVPARSSYSCLSQIFSDFEILNLCNLFICALIFYFLFPFFPNRIQWLYPHLLLHLVPDTTAHPCAADKSLQDAKIARPKINTRTSMRLQRWSGGEHRARRIKGIIQRYLYANGNCPGSSRRGY